MRPRHSEPPRRVVVIGAGITGLTAARELVLGRHGRPPEVVVLEALARPGGKIRTELVDGVSVETGPDSFVTLKPEMLELVKELGLQDELICTAADPTVSVYREGRLLPLPAGMNLVSPTRILPFALSPLFTLRGKLRMALEPLVAVGRGLEDESLADFARRRLGREALEVLVGPMLAGIYAGDPEKMSIKSTFPQLLEMERRGGLARSMWLGAPKRARREGLTTFMTLKSGLSRVVAALERALPPGTVRFDCPAQAVRRRGGYWEVSTPRGLFEADAVVAAAPAGALADAIEGLDPELSIRLREIPFVSTATTTLIYEAASFPAPPRGFGFLVPREAGSTLAAATFSSSKFPGRSPAGKVVIRAFIGGAGREESAEGPLTRIEERVREELHAVLGLKDVMPAAAKTARWIKANPQYNVGHERRLERMESCLKSHPGLILAGCSYGGVGLPDCVRSGRRAAALASSTRSRSAHGTARAGLA